MSDPHGVDPFEAGGTAQQNVPPSANPAQHQQVPSFDINNRANPPDYNIPNAFNSAFSGAGYGAGVPYQSYGNAYAGAHPGYNTGYPGGYAAGYNATGYNTTGYNPSYGYNFGRQGFTTAGQIATNARETSAMVLSGMHNAMTRFARVSSMIEDVLRNLHMLFDAIFGLGYSMGAFRQEMRLLVAIKDGPVGHVVRFVRRAASLWKLLCLFFMSPLAGRFSPVAFVLRVLGLVPEEDLLESSLVDMWRQREGEGGDDDHTGETYIPADSPNL